MINDQISLYCQFNKITKGTRTSFQSPALTQKYVGNEHHTPHQHLTKFHFDSTQDSKKNEHKFDFHYVATPMMTSQILK